MLTLGAQGCPYDKAHLEKVEANINKVLNNIKEKGFDEASFNKALHDVTFNAVIS